MENALDCSDGEIASIWGTKGTQNSLYANAVSYNSAGAMERLRLGNGKWETAKYNERLQVTEIGLGNSATDKSLLKLEFGYGTATQNNGSMRRQKISFNGLSQAFEQSYAYDDLNRLQSAEEKVNATTTWKQTFQFDRFGNRRLDAANTTTIGASNKVTNPLINTSDNRLKKDQDNDSVNDYDYDKNGNLTQDSEGKTFVYDAENHQKEVKINRVSKGTYLYDGDGKRVKKISDLETTIFVYNGGGQLVAEYSTQQSATPQVSFLTQDHLGSPRIITDNTGKVIARKDFNAFGDETNSAQRTTTLGYKPEEIRQDYTGYQKDDESGLEFAQARYYNTKHGRFTSVDPLTGSANVKDPQTFNRYSYAMNSPYKFTDPLGLLSVSTGACGICQGDGGGSFSAKERDDEEEVETEQTAARAEHSLPAAEQNANSMIEDTPIVRIDKVSVVDSIESDKDQYDQEEIVSGTTNKDTLSSGSSLDARVDISEARRRIDKKANLFLKVEISIIGEGSFASKEDTDGAGSVATSNANVKNLKIGSAQVVTKDQSTTATVYLELKVLNPEEKGSAKVNIRATVNYRENRYSNGKISLEGNLDRTKTTPLQIGIKYTP